MINRTKRIIILLGSIFILSACGDSGSTSTTSAAPSQTSSTSTSTTPIKDEAVTRAAVKIDDLTIKVHDNTFQTTSAFYTSVNKILSDFTRMSQSVTDRMDEEMKLLNTLAKPFEIASNYTNFFSVNSNYTATTPAFVISKPLSNNYFLVSSSSKFYLEDKTIKSYFKDSSALSNAWSRAIINADKTKDLYLSLLEIDTNGKVTQVTNSFKIKNATLKTY